MVVVDPGDVVLEAGEDGRAVFGVGAGESERTADIQLDRLADGGCERALVAVVSPVPGSDGGGRAAGRWDRGGRGGGIVAPAAHGQDGQSGNDHEVR